MAKTLNLPTDKVAEYLYKKTDDGKLTEEPNPEALAQLLALDQERVKALKEGAKGDGKTQFDNGHKKGLKDARDTLEKEIKAEYELESEAQGLELIKQVAAKLSGSSIAEDKVKLSPVYLALEQKAKAEKAALVEEWEGKYNGLTTEHKQKETTRTIGGLLRSELNTLNAVLPEDKTKADNIVNLFVNNVLGKYGFESVEGVETPVPTLKGKRVENAHGNAVNFNELAKQEAALLFNFQVQDPKGNGGNENGGKGGNGFKVPANENEYNAAIFNAKTIEERAEITTAYEATNGDN